MFVTFILLILATCYTLLFYFLLPLSPWFLFLWVFLGILLSFLSLILYVLIFIFIGQYTSPKSKVKHFLLWPLVRFANLFLKIHVHVIGRENIPNETFVVYGNHKSMLDVTIVYEAYHRVLSAVAKKSLGNVFLLKNLLKMIDGTTIDRDNDREGVKNLLDAIKKVKGGLNYLIFPEGGIKDRSTEELVNLRAGSYKLAVKSKATISPISIIGSSNLSKNCPKKKTSIQVIIHKPIKYEDYQNYNTFMLGEIVGEMINEGIETKQILDFKEIVRRKEENEAR